MNKVSLRKFCLALCLLLCVGNPSMAAEQRVAMGRYVEVPITLPTEGDLSFASFGGVIYCVGTNGKAILRSKDLNTWDRHKAQHDEEVAPAMGGINRMVVCKGGVVYLSSGFSMINEEGYSFIERIMDGKAKRIQLDQKLSSDTTRLAICVLPNGELLGLSDIEAYRFSAEGVTQQKYAVPAGESIAAYKNEVAICSPRNDQITVLDIESGQVLRTLPLPSRVGYGLSQINYDANGALYYVGPDGLYQSNEGSSMMTQIADGGLMTVSRPGVEARALLFDKENNPIIAYSENGTTSLIAYHYDDKVPTEPGTVLSVFALYDSTTLREYANRFQQKHPEVVVDVFVALPKGTAVTRDDAIRALNTKLLAGKGPDVIILDGLPIKSYIEKDVLEDLSSIVGPMIDSGVLLEKIVSAFKRNGSISVVPSRFLLPIIWGDVEGIHTLQDMEVWAQANPDVLPYYALDVESLVSTFYPTCAPAWFTENGRLDVVQVESFLTTMKTIRGKWTYEASVQKTGQDLKADVLSDGHQMSEWNPYNDDSMRSGTEESQGSIMMMMGYQKQLPYLLRGAMNTADVYGKVKAGKSDANFAALPGQAQGCYVPAMMMGVSKGTGRSETALEFIAYALDDESQRTDLSEGFPVNVSTLDAIQADKDKDGKYSGSNITIPGLGIEWESTWLNQAQRDQLRDIIDGLQVPVLPDLTLYQMIVQESTPFFKGQIDAQQAAQNVCAKANAYLSE